MDLEDAANLPVFFEVWAKLAVEAT